MSDHTAKLKPRRTENKMFVCVFCERTFNLAPHSCPNCNDYKGLMTIEEAVAEYGWLDYLVA